MTNPVNTRIKELSNMGSTAATLAKNYQHNHNQDKNDDWNNVEPIESLVRGHFQFKGGLAALTIGIFNRYAYLVKSGSRDIDNGLE
jgi:hypothetical protein